MSKFIVGLMVCALPILSFGQKETGTEIMSVEVFGTFGWKHPISKGIYIHWPDREVEKIINVTAMTSVSNRGVK